MKAIQFITNGGGHHPGEIAVMPDSQADFLVKHGIAVPNGTDDSDDVPWWTPRPDPLNP